MMRVRTTLPGYLAAVAELPVSTSPTAESAGSLVVLPGRRGWTDAVARATADGAAVVVVDEPGCAAVADLDALLRLDVPVVLSRSRLRADVADDARRTERAALVVGSCAAAPRVLAEVVRDAVGWIRTLGDAPVSAVSARGAEHGGIALLDVGGTPATLAVTALDPTARPRTRVTALGVERSDVETTPDGTTVTVSSESGARLLPARFEDAPRLALRRALAAGGAHADDVALFRADVVVADALVGGQGRLPAS